MTNNFPAAPVTVLRLGQLIGWRPGQLARNTALATIWQSVRLALQIAYLVLVARVLGAEGYGQLAGTVALAASLSSFVGIGFGLILIKQVSRDPVAFPVYWGRTLIAILVSTPIIVGITLYLATLLLPAAGGWLTIVLITCSELLFIPLITASSHAFQAHERLGQSIFGYVLLNALRLAGVLIMVVLGGHGIDVFAWFYFGATFLSAFVALFQVGRSFGRPCWSLGGMSGEFHEGFLFAMISVASNVHVEIDKTLLLRLGNAVDAGNYSIAVRVVSTASLPLLSYVLAIVPRLFRHGEQGVRSAAGLSRRLWPPILAYGLVVGLGIQVVAPWLPAIFGIQFGASVDLIRWLAPLPLLVGTSHLLLNVLSCSGMQTTRTLIESFGALFNIGLNLTLIPAMGVTGVIVSALLSQSMLSLLPLCVVLSRRDSAWVGATKTSDF